MPVFSQRSGLPKDVDLSGAGLLLGDFYHVDVREGYTHLSDKTRAMAGLAEHLRFRFLAKTDGDTFPCLSRATQQLLELPQEQQPRVYAGMLNKCGKVFPKGHKLHDPEFLAATGGTINCHPMYHQGAFYILGEAVVDHLNRSRDMLAVMSVEDAMMGLWLLGVDKVMLDIGGSFYCKCFTHPVTQTKLPSIRLLTAETKRRAVLLRACCSEYEVALDRLGVSAARLDDVRQDAQQQHGHHEHDQKAADAAAQQTVPPAGSSCSARPEASARSAISASFRGSSMEVAAEQVHGQESPEKQEQEREMEREMGESGATAAETEVASNFKSGMWAEISRYEAARRRFIGGNCGSKDGGGDGDEATKNWLRDLKAAEDVLLRGLDPDSAACCSAICLQGQNGASPDSEFLQWRELLLTQPQLASQRGFHSHDHGGAGSADGADPRRGEDGKGNVVGRGESKDWMGLGTLEEVARLQRSLLMLLDEVEGRRELLAHEFQQTKRNVATAKRGGSDGRRAEVVDGDERAGGMDRALRVFEDWYCWNKVAHVTSLLRERLDAMARGMAHDSGTGVGIQESLSEEARKLVHNPWLALGGERDYPLHSLSLPGPHLGCAHGGCGPDDHDNAWRTGWQQSSAAQTLQGTACLDVVQKLQVEAPSCLPHGSDCQRGHTAEIFAEQLRTTSILAAETDVSRLVDEDGESSGEEEESQPQTVSAGGGFPAADPPRTSPAPALVGVEPGCHSTTPGVEQNSGKQRNTDDTTVARAGEVDGRYEADHRSRLQPGACRVSRKRVAKLWSKLRAVAYITSLQAYSQERQKAYNLLTMEFVVASEYEDLDSKPVTGSGGDNADAAWLQGNMDMYTLANQKKRKQLKHAAAVQVKIHVLIIYPPVDLSWAMSNALKDWEKDNAGLETMNLNRFVDSIFELVDIWTETTEESEYLEMLDLLTEGITREIPRIGSLCWKTVEEIRYDNRITKVALTMADIVDRVDREEPEPSSSALDNGPRQGAALTKMHSFVEMKKVSKDRAGKGQGASSPGAKDLRPSFAMARWQKAVSVALVVSKSGNSGGLHQYIKSGKNKQGLIKGDKLLVHIAKIYKAKEQVEAKMRALEKDEGRLAPGKRRKHHRLDRFLLQYYIRQFGTKALARKKLRQFVSSISIEGLSHPRVTLFAKLSGIPVSDEDGRQFRPFALTDYFLPIVRSLVPPGEDLDHWMGSGKEPTYVPRHVFTSAVLRILKSVPETSEAMTAFHKQLTVICEGTDQRKAQEQFQRSIKRSQHQAGKRESVGGFSGSPPLAPTTRSPPTEKDRMPKGARDKRYLELDRALLALVPLWEAEEAWRLWNHTITVAVLTRRSPHGGDMPEYPE
eukprot:g15979.t1